MATLPFLLDLIERLRRALNKSGRSLFVVADAFAEARRDWCSSKYPFAE